MIEPAYKYKSELQELHLKTIYDNRYKYYYNHKYRDFELNISDSDWSRYQAVSLRKGKIIGYLKAELSRDNSSVDSLNLICFDNEANIHYGNDVKRFVRFLFSKGIRKISFGCFIGNPVEKSYDKLVKHLGGRIIGIRKQHETLSDNKIYDLKMYEIFNKNWKPTLK